MTMKVGDLVVLSSYGRARNFNNRITNKNPFQTGLITKIRKNSAYPYTVTWSMPAYHDTFGVGHTRRELMYARKTKCNESR